MNEIKADVSKDKYLKIDENDNIIEDYFYDSEFSLYDDIAVDKVKVRKVLFDNDIISIKDFNGVIKKIIYHKFVVKKGQKINRSKKGSVNDVKLVSNLIRAKQKVLEYSICNEFEYFCTFSLCKEKYDRFNLEVFYKDFSQWIRDKRKSYETDIQYIFIPELHEDGAWHLHGVIKGIPFDKLFYFKDYPEEKKLPKKLRYSEYLNWEEYENKFGFCSFGKIKSTEKVSHYILKYISKNFVSEKDSKKFILNKKLYYCSRGLKKASLIACGGATSEIKEYDCVTRGIARNKIYENEFISVGYSREDNEYLKSKYIINTDDIISFDKEKINS